MARDIRPLLPDEIPELSRFLTRGFGTPDDADFAAPDVLHWKYFEPRGGRCVPVSLVAREAGEIVGHVGFCQGWFRPTADQAREISTLHGIDWLSSRDHPNTGAALMMRGHRYAETQYALNYSEAARRVIRAAGYELMAPMPVFHKVLRPGHRLRGLGEGLARRFALAARDLARAARHRGRPPHAAVELRAVRAFGPEVDAILDGVAMDLIASSRHPDWLNHALRHPRACMSGWLVHQEGRLRGFALLNVVRLAEARVGRIVDCFLDLPDPDVWHAAVDALTRELRAQEADVAESFGSTPWMAGALREAGYYPALQINFLLRDRRGLLPPGATYHLTPLEADYAYSTG